MSAGLLAAHPAPDRALPPPPHFPTSPLISLRDNIAPKLRPLSWLMRLIEEIYDNRYARDTAELREEAEGAAGAVIGAAGKAGDAEQEKSQVVKNCMRGRGYRVLN